MVYLYLSNSITNYRAYDVRHGKTNNTMKKLLVIISLSVIGCTTCDEVKDKRTLHNQDYTTIIHELYVNQDGDNEWVIVDERTYFETFRGDCY